MTKKIIIATLLIVLASLFLMKPVLISNRKSLSDRRHIRRHSSQHLDHTSIIYTFTDQMLKKAHLKFPTQIIASGKGDQTNYWIVQKCGDLKIPFGDSQESNNALIAELRSKLNY